MMFNPLNDNIIAEPEEATEKSRAGILLGSGGSREQPRLAKVLAVGPKVERVKTGDRILFQAFATSDLQVGDDNYIAIREEFIVAVVEPQKERE